MKIFPALLVFAAALGSASAVEIREVSYTTSQSWSGGQGQVGGGSFLVPGFDITKQEIPDDAVLLSVKIEITDKLYGYGQFWNNTPEPISFSGKINLSKSYNGQSFSQQTAFSGLVVAPGGNGYANAVFENTFVLNPLPALILGQTGSFYYLSRSDGVNLFDVQPGIQGDLQSGTALNVEYGGVTTTARATFIYATNEVPDGGSTLSLLLAGMASLRLTSGRAGRAVGPRSAKA